MSGWSRVLGAIALAGALGGCGSFGSSGRELSALPDFVPGARITTQWQTTLAGSPVYVFAPVEIGSGAVVVAGADGVVARFNAGKPAWRVELGTPLAAGVGSDGKLVVVVSRAGEAIALDAENGSEKWRAAVGAEVLAAPSVGGTAVAIRASDSRVFGFAPSDGRRMWVYQRPTPSLSLRSHAGLLTEDKVAVGGFPGGKLVAINLANGGAMWELTVALPKGTTELERISDVVGTPVLHQRELCAVAFQGRLACFDVTNGNLVWARDVSSAVGLDRDADRIYVVDEAGAVLALDASSGASVWKQDKLAGRRPGRPLAVGRFVLVVDGQGYVSALHRDDGTLVAREATDGSPAAADPIPLGDEGVVVQTVKGGVFALNVH